MELSAFDNVPPQHSADSIRPTGTGTASARNNESFAHLFTDDSTRAEPNRGEADHESVDPSNNQSTPPATDAKKDSEQPTETEHDDDADTGADDQLSTNHVANPENASPRDQTSGSRTAGAAGTPDNSSPGQTDASGEDAIVEETVVAANDEQPASTPALSGRQEGRQKYLASEESQASVADTADKSRSDPLAADDAHATASQKASTLENESTQRADVTTGKNRPERKHKSKLISSANENKATRAAHGDASNNTQPSATATVTSNQTTAPLEDHLSTSPQSPGGGTEQSSAEAATASQSNNLTAQPTATADQTSKHLLTRNTTHPDMGHELSQADQSRLLQRVARAIDAAPGRGGILRLRLRPPELGSLHLEVRMEDGALHARLETETQMARSVLIDNLPQLRDRLEQQGIRVDRFDVNVSQQDAGQSQQQTGHAYDQPHIPDYKTDGSSPDKEVEEQVPNTSTTHIISQKNLNVVI